MHASQDFERSFKRIFEVSIPHDGAISDQAPEGPHVMLLEPEINSPSGQENAHVLSKVVSPLVPEMGCPFTMMVPPDVTNESAPFGSPQSTTTKNSGKRKVEEIPQMSDKL